MNTFKEDYKTIYNRLIPKTINKLLQLYVAGYNIYGWYWLYKLIFVLKSNWEEYAIWFFAMAGQLFFILDNRGKLKIKYMESVE